MEKQGTFLNGPISKTDQQGLRYYWKQCPALVPKIIFQAKKGWNNTRDHWHTAIKKEVTSHACQITWSLGLQYTTPLLSEVFYDITSWDPVGCREFCQPRVFRVKKTLLDFHAYKAMVSKTEVECIFRVQGCRVPESYPHSGYQGRTAHCSYPNCDVG